MSLEFVITRLCRDCIDGSCLEVCPVDVIWQHDGQDLPNQLFIEPELCIGCGACAPECPWEAIYCVDEVPEAFADDIDLNRITLERPDEFSVPAQLSPHRAPSPEAVRANRDKWLNLAHMLDKSA